MFSFYRLSASTLLLASITTCFADPIDLEQELQKVKVRVQLKGLYAIDQTMRREFMKLEEQGIKSDDLYRMPGPGDYFESVDRSNLQVLKKIVRRWGWPSISKFGEEADNNAWIIVQHADYDRPYQKKILKLLDVEMKNHDTLPRNYAYLYDRVKVGEHKPQSYGTQGHCIAKAAWEPFPIEDLPNVDQRRQTVGLQPLAEYTKWVSAYCY